MNNQHEYVLKPFTTLNEFMEWVQQFDSGSYLFRGVQNAEYRIEASAFRHSP